MSISFRNIGWKFKATVSLFVFLIFFYITPNSHAIVHTVVHDQEISHTHSDAGEDHSQEDHQSGKVHDHYFDAVSVTLQSHARLSSIFFSESLLKCFVRNWEMPFQHNPPGLVLDRYDEVVQPSFLTEFRASHPLRAPPSA